MLLQNCARLLQTHILAEIPTISIDEVFTGYNDINEETRMQLELINKTLAELQAKNRELNKPRKPIGYQHYNKESEG